MVGIAGKVGCVDNGGDAFGVVGITGVGEIDGVVSLGNLAVCICFESVGTFISGICVVGTSSKADFESIGIVSNGDGDMDFKSVEGRVGSDGIAGVAVRCRAAKLGSMLSKDTTKNRAIEELGSIEFES